MIPYIFCALYVMLFWTTGMEVVITPDSDGYITFSVTRTVGYPLFLLLVKTLTGSYKFVPHIQLALLWASVGYVAHGLPTYLRWPWLLGMVAVSFVMKQCYCFEIMAEPLFITLLLTWAGLMLHRSSIVWISLCIGGLILIRPSAYALLPALLVYIWHQRQSWLKSLAPIAACLLLGVGAQGIKNGVYSTQSFLGCVLIGKVPLTVQPNMESTDPNINTLIKRMGDYMLPIQNLVNQSPSEPIRYFLAATVYDVVRFKKMVELEQGLSISPEQHDKFLRNTALKIIQQNPWSYIQDVWMNWQALWFVWDLLPEEQRVVRAQYAENMSKQFPEMEFTRLEHRAPHPTMVYLLRACLGTLLLLSLLSIFGQPWWKRAYNQHSDIVMCVLSLAVHGSLLLTALVQAGLLRYVLIFWPYFGLLTLLWIGKLYEQRCRSHSVL